MFKHLSLIACLLVGVVSSTVWAGPVDTTIDLGALHCIRTRVPNDDDTKTDQIYIHVTGVAQGKAISALLPKGKTAGVSPKVMGADAKNPMVIWKGSLAEGEFVALTLTLFQAKDANKRNADQLKAYVAKQTAAFKSVAALAKKTGDEKTLKAARSALNKANRKIVAGIKQLFPAGKGDRFGGLVDVIVINEGGKLKKFATPVGLTTGDDFGIRDKVYSKIKYTRENVMIKDENGQWYEVQMDPVAPDTEDMVYIKMLETESKGDQRNVTDYLLGLRVQTAGKNLSWILDGEHPGPTIIHDYWDWAY
jgi:hypothetical protein